MKFRWLVLLAVACPLVTTSVSTQILQETKGANQMVMTNLASQPLAFTENRGQWDQQALFKAEAGGATFWFCKDEVVYQFIRNTDELEEPPYPEMREMPDRLERPRFRKESMVIKAQFVGANPGAEIMGEGRLSHNCNYFYGNDPGKWRTDVPNFSTIIYKNIYPGIDLRYYGDGRSMKYDFIVNPGADLSNIGIKYEGINDISVTPAGDLEARTRFGPVYEKAPYVYQEMGDQRQAVAARYEVRNDAFGFALGDGFDSGHPVIIDPELVYSTYLGGNQSESGKSIAVDNLGYAFVVGYTNSTNFPTINPYDGSHNGAYDVFVAKLSASGNSLLYSTFIGGSAEDIGNDIAIDGNGNAYITGETQSDNFPTVNPYESQHYEDEDVFVLKLGPNGNILVYSTYINGGFWDVGYGIAVDAYGYAYITGYTYGDGFVCTPGAYNCIPDGGDLVLYSDAFVTKLGVAGNTVIFSTFLGGGSYPPGWGSYDMGYDIALDGSRNVYVTGQTGCDDFPTVNPIDDSLNGASDAFITKLSASGSALIFSTYLGGDVGEAGEGIGVDVGRNVYITGSTASINFPVVNAYDSTLSGQDAFIAKISNSGNSLIFSTYLGGGGIENAYSIAVDGLTNTYVTGRTNSTNFPVINFYDGSSNGGDDVFVTKLSALGNSLVYSTFLGGSSNDIGYGVALDLNSNPLVAGLTNSPNFPRVNPYDSLISGTNDAFVAKFAEIPSCTYDVGDINGSGQANGIDVTYGVSYLKGGNAPADSCNCPPLAFPFYAAMDVNGSCNTNGIDITYFVSYLKGGPTLQNCADCPPATRK
ncbi:MAG: hypothetical protein A2W25_07855 [candidate division Zixibacteria bacterium RBG_16_53_22]|nr:MAG: hypothetical protein A2W25_07855 [candidate division Zixibacteria bacterium RBG_16_53_22]